MKTKPWTPEEIDSLIKLLEKSTELREAIVNHNKVWRTGRTPQGTLAKFKRDGLSSPHSYLIFEKDKGGDTDLGKVKRLIGLVKGSIRSVTDLCNEMNMSPRNLLELIEYAQHKGYNIKPKDRENVFLDLRIPKVTEIRHIQIKPVARTFKFAACGDIHKGAIHARHAEFEDYINLAYDQGVQDVFVAGDILAGINMYRGQTNEVEAWSGEKQIEIAKRTMPEKKGMTYHLIGGNHDESFYKASGLDAVAQLAHERDDMVHYGFHQALVDVNGIKIELFHPDKAAAYAITYHLQKGIEATPSGIKPHIALYGHTHQSVYLPSYRGIAAFYVGCFEDQNLFLKRKHIQPMIGGWIIEVGLTEDGEIRFIKPTSIHYRHGTRYEGNPIMGSK